MSRAEGAVRHARLLLVVGLTGVGKSTLVASLAARRDLRVLPNRRELTDAILIPMVQRREGRAEVAVRDRLERFRLTAAYRRVHPGGMAHALATWLAAHGSPGDAAGPLVFDNLRGLDEVRAALDAFPDARFLVLDAPLRTRLFRLALRRDPFDRAAGAGTGASPPAGATAGATAREADRTVPEATGFGASTAAADLARRLRAVPGFGAVLDPDDIAAAAGPDVDENALVAAAEILVEEQRNYDSAAARAFLAARLPASRLLDLDTSRVAPAAAVERILAWWDAEPRDADRAGAP